MKHCVRLGALLLAALLLAGCAPRPASVSLPPAGAEAPPVEVSVAIWGIEEGLSDPDDAILKRIEERTGVRLVPQAVTWDDYEQKILLWATGGTLPDIFASDSFAGKAVFHEWIDQGVIRALPQDLSAYPHLREYLTMDRAVAAMQEGRYYMIPRQSYGDITFSVLDRTVAYRWDLAQAAGVTKEPETYEEFREMICRIIAADPEGTGVGGLTQTIPDLLGGFIYPYGGIVDKKWVRQDGEYLPSYFAGDLAAAMQLARDMYEEGSIERNIIYAKMNSARQKFISGQSAAILFGGGANWLYLNIAREYEAQRGGSFLDDVKIAKLYPGADGNKYYFVDTEAYSETYIAGHVGDEKMAAILRLYDYLCSEEGKLLCFCGIEGVDYARIGGEVVMRGDVMPGDNHPFIRSNANCLAMWNPTTWDFAFPSSVPDAYRRLNARRHDDAVQNGTLPEYFDSILFLSTPLKDAFVFNPRDDLYEVMMGSEPVEDMVAALLARYEAAGLSAMLQEVNTMAADMG